MSGPYRDSRPIPRFLCIVCYKSLSSYDGPCRTCGVPRLDLSDPAVREQVRLEAERRLQKSMYREYSALALSSGALVAPAMWWVGGLALVLVAPVTMVIARVYAGLRRNSAIATYAARRRRISAELGVDVHLDDVDRNLLSDRPRSSATGLFDKTPATGDDHALGHPADLDPLQLEMEPLLAWLGAKLDD